MQGLLSAAEFHPGWRSSGMERDDFYKCTVVIVEIRSELHRPVYRL